MKPVKNKMDYRFENFGGIIASNKPPFLAFVDRDYMRSLGLDSPKHWKSEDESIGLLSAPTEVHFAATNKCNVSCRHCYMDSGKQLEQELTTEQFKEALDILAELKVFHIALGGGEAILRKDFFEIAEYAREKGLVPNLTISGVDVKPSDAEKMKILGQVNISIDGVGDDYAIYRGVNHFETVDKVFDMLAGQNIPVGINCVIGSANFNLLESIFAYAAGKNANEIEFLRFKPAGRGAEMFNKYKLTNEQNIELIPLLKSLSEKYQIISKVDCSFVPMICWHQPPIDELYAMATYGCEAGNVLLGITSDGRVSGCSFLSETNLDLDVFKLRDPSARMIKFAKFFDWTKNAPMPCKNCKYLEICKGGCHAVAQFVTGSFANPDPGCPTVTAYNQKGTVS